MNLTYTEIKERCRTKIDTALRLKPSLPEGYDRVVLQTAIRQAGDIVRKGSVAEIEAATAKLQRLIDVYRPPGERPLSVPAPSQKAKAARTRAALEAAIAQKKHDGGHACRVDEDRLPEPNPGRSVQVYQLTY